MASSRNGHDDGRPARADLGRLHVVVPVRGLEGGKARLGDAADAEERGALIVGMLRHVLGVVREWPACRAVHLVTSDPAVAAVGTRLGARVVPDTTGELNGALRAGREAAVAARGSAILCLPADLPLLDTAALDRVLDAADAAIAAGRGAPVVVVAPSDARGGTNALLLSPPYVIDPSFGPASLEAHARSAAAAGSSLQLVVDPRLGFDLDTPDDLERLEPARIVELLRAGEEFVPA